MIVGAGYTIYGASLVMLRKKPKWMAIATGLFATTLMIDAVMQWRNAAADDIKVLGGSYKPNGLGESINDSLARVKSAGLRKELVRAPTLDDRIKILRKLTQEGSESTEIREKALAVLSRKCGTGKDRRWCIPEKGWEQEVVQLFEAYRNPANDIAVRYARDPIGKDTYSAASKTLKIGAGDCDDSAVTLNALFGSIGYSTKFRVIQAKGATGASHIYNLVGVPPGPPERVQKWIPLDATMDKPAGWEAPESMIVQKWDFDV